LSLNIIFHELPNKSSHFIFQIIMMSVCQSSGSNQMTDLIQQPRHLRRLYMSLNNLKDNYHQLLRSVPSLMVLKWPDARSFHGMMNIFEIFPSARHRRNTTISLRRLNLRLNDVSYNDSNFTNEPTVSYAMWRTSS